MNNYKNVLNENRVNSRKKLALKKSHKYLKGGKSSKKKKSIKSPLNVADNISSGFSNVFNTLTNMIMGEPPDVKFLSVPYVSGEEDKKLKTNMTSESKEIFMEQIGSSPEGRAFRDYLEKCQVVDDEDGEQEGGGENEEGQAGEKGEDKKVEGEQDGEDKKVEGEQDGEKGGDNKEGGEALEEEGQDSEKGEEAVEEEDQDGEKGEEAVEEEGQYGEKGEEGEEGEEDGEKGEEGEEGEEEGEEGEEEEEGEEGEEGEWTYTITPGQLKNYAEKFCLSREDLFDDEDKKIMFKLPDEDINFEASTKCEGEDSEEESDDDEHDEEEEEDSQDEWGNHPEGYEGN